jgi:hypothetical protein
VILAKTGWITAMNLGKAGESGVEWLGTEKISYP